MLAALRGPRLAILALGVGLLVLLAVLVGWHATRPIDVAIIEAVRSPTLLAPLASLQALTELGATPSIVAVTVAILVALSALGRWWLGLAGTIAVACVAAANALTKGVVQRARPDLLPPLVSATGYSFPSGHAAFSMVAYGIVAVLIARSALPAWLRGLIVALVAALVAAIGLSRIYLGVHYPSDVLGGWLAGGLIVFLFATLTAPPSAAAAGATRPPLPGVAALSPAARRLRGGSAAAADQGEPQSDRPAPG